MSPPSWRWSLRSTASFGLPALAALAVWLVFPDVRHQSDLVVFLRAGHDVLHGSNPFTPNDDPFLWSGHAFVYPWLAAFGFAPLSVLPHDLALAACYLVGVVSMVVGARLLGVRSPGVTSALLVAAPVVRNAELGAVNALFFLAGAALWRWRDRPWVVAVTVVVLVGTKLFLAPLLVWVVLTRSRWCAVLTTGSLAVFFAVSFGLGPVSLPSYLHSMGLLSDHEALGSSSLRHLCALLLPGSQALVPVVVALLVLLQAVLRRDDRVLFVGCLVTGMALTPIFWTHYVVLGLLGLLVVRPRWTLAAVPLSWVLTATSRQPHTLGGLSLEHRLALLWALLLLMPCLVSRDDIDLDRELAQLGMTAVPECVGGARGR